MNAFQSTAWNLQSLLCHLHSAAVREFAPLTTNYRILIGAPGTERTETNAYLVGEIEDYEREINSIGAAAEILAKALREMDEFDVAAEEHYEGIWSMRNDARQMASLADDMLYV